MWFYNFSNKKHKSGINMTDLENFSIKKKKTEGNMSDITISQ